MGREHRKRYKEDAGRPAVVGNEVVNMGLAAAPGVLANSAMADGFTVSAYKVKRAAKVDAMTIQCEPQLVAGSGTVTVRLNVNGVEMASGTIAAGDRAADVTWETEELNELNLVADDEVTLDTTKGATPSGVSVSARVLLRLYE